MTSPAEIAELVKALQSKAQSQRAHAEGWDKRWAHTEAANARLLADLLGRAAAALEEVGRDAQRIEAMTKATFSHIDGRDLLHQLQPNGAHHIDIVVRINGEDRRYEGDWLKTLTHARDGHNMGEYADNPKLRAMIENARQNPPTAGIQGSAAIDAAISAEGK